MGFDLIPIRHVFTAQDFTEIVIKDMGKWYKRDDNQKELDKPKLGIFDGISYDKTYNDIKTIIAKVPNKNNLLEDSILDNICNKIKKYRGKKSPNKLKYVNQLLVSVESIKEYINKSIREKLKGSEDAIKQSISKTMRQRDIKVQIELLGDKKYHHKSCQEIKKLLNIYMQVFNENKATMGLEGNISTTEEDKIREKHGREIVKG